VVQLAKHFHRPGPAAELLGISPAQFYADIAAGALPLTLVKIGERAVGIDDDELLRVQLNKIADAKGLAGAERAAWIYAEFIRQKADAERVAEYRAKTERKPRGIHAKRRLAAVEAA
jgi:predicted DNA-binding transcriptional regulator AlpA